MLIRCTCSQPQNMPQNLKKNSITRSGLQKTPNFLSIDLIFCGCRNWKNERNEMFSSWQNTRGNPSLVWNAPGVSGDPVCMKAGIWENQWNKSACQRGVSSHATDEKYWSKSSPKKDGWPWPEVQWRDSGGTIHHLHNVISPRDRNNFFYARTFSLEFSSNFLISFQTPMASGKRYKWMVSVSVSIRTGSESLQLPANDSLSLFVCSCSCRNVKT